MLKKYIRRTICMLMIMATVFNCNIASAAVNPDEQIGTKSINLSEGSVIFTISAYGAASIYANVEGKAGTSKIVMTVKLQKYNTSSGSWERVQNWKITENDRSVTFEDVYGLFLHGRYRVRVVSVLTRNGVDEEIAFNSVERVY